MEGMLPVIDPILFKSIRQKGGIGAGNRIFPDFFDAGEDFIRGEFHELLHAAVVYRCFPAVLYIFENTEFSNRVMTTQAGGILFSNVYCVKFSFFFSNLPNRRLT